MLVIKKVEKNFINFEDVFILTKKIGKIEWKVLIKEYKKELILKNIRLNYKIRNNQLSLCKSISECDYVMKKAFFEKIDTTRLEYIKLPIKKQISILENFISEMDLINESIIYFSKKISTIKKEDVIHLDENRDSIKMITKIIKEGLSLKKDHLFLHFLNNKGLLFYPPRKCFDSLTSSINRYPNIDRIDQEYLDYVDNFKQENQFTRHENKRYNDLFNRLMYISNKKIKEFSKEEIIKFFHILYNYKYEDDKWSRGDREKLRAWANHLYEYSKKSKGNIKSKFNSVELQTKSKRAKGERKFIEDKNSKYNQWYILFNKYLSKIDTSIDRAYLRLKTWMEYIESLEKPILNPDEIIRSVHINDLKDINTKTFRNYLENMNNGNAAKRQIFSAFRSFLLYYQQYHNYKYIVPIDPIVDYWVEKNKHRKTTRMPIDSEIVDDLKELLIKNDFEWLRKENFLMNNALRLYDSKGNLHRDVFCPSAAVALYTLLTIPLRFSEVLLLDSGEGDDLIYDFKGNKMTKNMKKIGDEKKRQFGAIQKLTYNSIKEQDTTVLRVVTDKIQDEPRDIPFLPIDLLDMLKIQLKFIKKWTPNPKIINEQEFKKNNFNNKKNKEIYPLFRDLAAIESKKMKPVSQTKVRQLWGLLCFELEKRYKEKGLSIQLTDGNDAHGVPKSVYDIHSLRVTGVTNFIERGVPIHIIQENLVGHSTMLMTSYYNKQSFFEQRKILEDAYNKRREIPNYRKMDELDKNKFRRNLFSNKLGEGIAESWLNKNDAGVKISFSGVCSGGLCEEGSFLTGQNNQSLPVPRGWRNPSCFQCKFWLTGPDFLLGQQLEFNQLTDELHEKSKHLESLRKELIIAEKEDSINKNILKGEVDKDTDIWYNMLVEWQNRLHFMEKSIAMLKQGVSEKTLIKGNEEKFEMNKDCLPIERKIHLSMASEYFPEIAIKNKMTIFEMEKVMSKFLRLNNYPHLMIDIDSKQKLNMMNNMFGILLDTLDGENKEKMILGLTPLEKKDKESFESGIKKIDFINMKNLLGDSNE